MTVERTVLDVGEKIHYFSDEQMIDTVDYLLDKGFAVSVHDGYVEITGRR